MIREYTVYPKVYIEIYKLFKKELGPNGSISPMLFDENTRQYLFAMEKAKILKFTFKNLAVCKELPSDFIDQLNLEKGE